MLDMSLTEKFVISARMELILMVQGLVLPAIRSVQLVIQKLEPV